MGIAHVAAVPVALAAVTVHLDSSAQVDGGRPLIALCAAALAFALLYHLALPRHWLSRRKVLLGLVVDAALVSGTVRVTGGHMSLLVFLYYLIVVAGALTLGGRELIAVCAVVTAMFAALLPFDPLLTAAPRAHVAHVVLFVASVWLVGLASGAGARQIQVAERRLMTSLRTQRAVSAENAALSVDLVRLLEESRALAASLESQREQTRRLADMVIRAQEEERHRVARELHDEANQTLAALLTTIDALEARVGAGAEGADVVAGLQRLHALAAAALTDLQRIAVELRPPALDEFGLVPALTRHVRDRAEGTGMQADVAVEGRRRRLEPAVEVALYRIAQESLANAQKHSGAACVRVRLRFAESSVRLDVVDDGRGFVPHLCGSGLGIAGMRERASLVGGDVEVTSRPMGGTRVTAVVPLRGEPQTAETLSA